MVAKAFGELAWGEANSKNNGSTKPVSVNFDIGWVPLVAVSVAKLEGSFLSRAHAGRKEDFLKIFAASRRAKPHRGRLRQPGSSAFADATGAAS